MEQEEKEVLLKDLCARLPYGVKVQDELGRINKLVIGNADLVRLYYNDFSTYSEEKLSLPYLFPLSNMTEEQKEEYCQLQQKVIYNSKGVVNEDITKYINWCYKNHLDINDLIPKELAIDATGLNIYQDYE